MKINKNKYIIIIIGILIFIMSSVNVNAEEVYSGQISPTIARLRQIGAPNVSHDMNIDATFSKNVANIRLTGDNVNTSTTLSVFFNTLSYFGWKGYHYKFSGYLNSHNNAYSTITGVDIANGNGDIIGVCDYKANGNETQYQSFTLDCMVPSGLSSGAYSNIIDFQFATLGNTPANLTNFDIYISSKMAVYKIDDASNSQIISQIQQQQQQQREDSKAIQDKMDKDIDESDKEAPNQDEYNEAKEKENNIIGSISDVSPNDITFSQDIQATNKIWELTTKILQTNAKVMGLVISVLSIGIIKLIMNR